MILRTFLVGLLISLVLLIVIYFPTPLPQTPKDTRLVKIDSQGEALLPWQGPWQCVFDTKTGLLWEVKSDKEDIHDAQCSFSWFNGTIGAVKGGSCFVGEQISDTSDLINTANAESFCGSNSWRLPSSAELSTILIDNPHPGEPLIARDFFPYGKRGSYWTSEHGKPLEGHYAYLKEGAATVSFINRNIVIIPYQNTPFARLVSSTKPKQFDDSKKNLETKQP